MSFSEGNQIKKRNKMFNSSSLDCEVIYLSFITFEKKIFKGKKKDEREACGVWGRIFKTERCLIFGSNWKREIANHKVAGVDRM